MSDVEENNFEGRVSGLPCAGHVEEGIGPEDGGWRCSAASGLAGVGAAQLGSKMAPSGARGLPGPWVTARVPLSCPRLSLTRSLLPSPRWGAGAESGGAGRPPPSQRRLILCKRRCYSPRRSSPLLCVLTAVPSRLVARRARGSLSCPFSPPRPWPGLRGLLPPERGGTPRSFVRGARSLPAQELPLAGPPLATGEVRPSFLKPLKLIDRAAEGFERAAVAL